MVVVGCVVVVVAGGWVVVVTGGLVVVVVGLVVLVVDEHGAVVEVLDEVEEVDDVGQGSAANDARVASPADRAETSEPAGPPPGLPPVPSKITLVVSARPSEPGSVAVTWSVRDSASAVGPGLAAAPAPPEEVTNPPAASAPATRATATA